MIPHHRANDQLRTEPAKQRQHNDKYVSAFASGTSEVDMSFRNALLEKSADHFRVGIDELTVNLNNLSMLEPSSTDVLFRIIRRGYQAPDGTQLEAHLNFLMPDGPAGDPEKWRDAFSFRLNRNFNTLAEVLDAANDVAIAVGSYIREFGLVNGPGNYYAAPLQAAQGNLRQHEHFLIMLSPNGQLKFLGNRLFWANFVVEFPIEKYRQIIHGSPTKRYVSLHPGTGAVIEPYNNGTVVAWNPLFDGTVAANLGDLDLTTERQFVSDSNLLNTLDRRVTLEVGCSLPVKNSPMVDHGKESPDFVLGRYMFQQPYDIMHAASQSSEPELIVRGLGARQMIGPSERVCYHHLQPQQKIQIMRLKLWARVRTYDATTQKWGMNTIVCPVSDIDYWHIRLHFIEK
jgi:hypothetical protein